MNSDNELSDHEKRMEEVVIGFPYLSAANMPLIAPPGNKPASTKASHKTVNNIAFRILEGAGHNQFVSRERLYQIVLIFDDTVTWLSTGRIGTSQANKLNKRDKHRVILSKKGLNGPHIEGWVIYDRGLITGDDQRSLIQAHVGLREKLAYGFTRAAATINGQDRETESESALSLI